MRKIKNPWLDKPGYNCFGCSPDNTRGVRMTFYEDGDDIVSFWTPESDYQGWIDTLHGGIQCVLLDEICAWVIFRKLQVTGVTSKLEIKYLKPLKTTDSQYTLRAHIVDRHRNIVFVEATIENANGEKCSEVKATYFTFSEEKSKEMGFNGCELEGDEMLPM